MAFQVANGSIPETVERFLRERVGVRVVRLGPVVRFCVLAAPALPWDVEIEGQRGLYFRWPHDREPTLQEAIEAVMAQRD